MARCAVLQAKPGFGDVIWHLPFVRAIAARSPGGKVTFLAPPRSGAAELLAAEPSIVEVLYFEHHGSELRRGINQIRLATLLHRKRFDVIWILDRTLRPAIAAVLAGIPQRIGVGLGPQRLFITNSGIDRMHFHDHPIDWLRTLMVAMNVPLATVQPELRVPGNTLAKVEAKFGSCARPWIVLGLGTHPDKDWPTPHCVVFLAGLRQRVPGTAFLIGGQANVTRAAEIASRSSDSWVRNACDLSIGEAAALLHQSDLFIGPDSGPMNIAAATATEAFGLFGTTPVFNNSRFIHPIVPEGGPAPGGMSRIPPALVLATIEPYLVGLSP
jgi:heptosyltransferase-2